MKRVLVDYTSAVYQGAGIGRLTRELMNALVAIPKNYQLDLLVLGQKPANFTPPTPLLRSTLNDRWWYRIWYKANLPVQLNWVFGHCDLYHATDFVLPPLARTIPTLLTVHDLSFEHYPESVPPRLLPFLRKVVPASVRRATHIVADSKATAKDLTELYGVPQNKITVLYSGVGPQFSPVTTEQHSAESASLRQKYGLGTQPFILTVGTLQPRKNHLMLVQAFAALLGQLGENANLQLVIAGGQGWSYDKVYQEVSAHRLEDKVKFVGYIEEEDLPALYRAAKVFAFPSLYEGFGLPLLEAMASGTPVVSSDASCLPEVGGDTVLYANPHNTQVWTATLYRALYDTPWQTWTKETGLKRAGSFNWENAAKKMSLLHEKTEKKHT